MSEMKNKKALVLNKCRGKSRVKGSATLFVKPRTFRFIMSYGGTLRKYKQVQEILK